MQNSVANSQPSPGRNSENWQGHVILCGINNLGFRIWEQLAAAGMPVVVIDDDPENRLARQIHQAGYTILAEDSRLQDVLVRAGIGRAVALITVEEDDLHNLETVLAANEIVPGIRTVASFFNQEIGKQLVSTVRNARSVSQSEKAGPAFVSAALPSRLLNLFQLKVQSYQETIGVVQLEVNREASLKELYGKLSVIALYRPPPTKRRGVPTEDTKNSYFLCPPKTTQVKPGDRVTVVGRVEELENLDTIRLTQVEIDQAEQVQEATEGVKAVSMQSRKRVGRLLRARRVTGRLIRKVDRPFRYALLGFGLVILLGTIIFKFFYTNLDATGHHTELDWISAVYFTVTIVSTIGFGDFNLGVQEWPLKIFGIFMELAGATSVAILYAFLTNFLISLRLDEELGHQQATEMEDHIVICGLGTVGYKMLQGLLERGQQVVVVEHNPNNRFVSEARALGVPVLNLDIRVPGTLRIANVPKAKCVAVMTTDDLANLQTALIARSLLPNIRVVLRLFDRSLADKVERTFNIQTALSASAIAAPAFIAEAFDYEQLSSFYVDRTPFTAAKEIAERGSRLNGITVGQLQEQYGVVVLAHLRKPIQVAVNTVNPNQLITNDTFLELADIEPTFYPPANLLINEGDSIVFIGPYDRIANVHQLNSAISTI